MLITLKAAAERILAANKILLTAHVNPDGDAIGSTLAVMQMVRSFGKSAQVFIDDTIRKNFQVLPHAEEIRRPKDGEKFDADLMIILDTSIERIGNVKTLTDAPILNIDHHITNKNAAGDLYLEAEAAATCEIVFKLARELNATITPEIATCIYTGLATDTGFFKFSNTSAETFAIASELIRCGVSPHFISEEMEKKSLAEVRGLIAALNSLKMFYDDKVAGIFIDYETAKTFDSTEGFVDEIRVIDTVDLAFLIIEQAPNVCRMRLRSKGINVAKIANKLGGGGHIRAAGCTLKTTLAEAEKILLATIDEAINNEE